MNDIEKSYFKDMKKKTNDNFLIDQIERFDSYTDADEVYTLLDEAVLDEDEETVIFDSLKTDNLPIYLRGLSFALGKADLEKDSRFLTHLDTIIDRILVKSNPEKEEDNILNDVQILVEQNKEGNRIYGVEVNYKVNDEILQQKYTIKD